MALWATYLSIVDTIDSWVDTPNAVDNNIVNLATYTGIALKTMILDTPFLSVETGVISKVEMRAYCSLADLGVPVKLRLIPRYIAGDGDWEDVSQNLGWTSWYDITADTNAPGSWEWSDISAIGASLSYYWGSGPVPLAEVGSVEIRVTYAGVIDKKFVTSRNYYY